MALSNRFNLLPLLITASLFLVLGCGGDDGGRDNLAPRIFTFEAESEIVEPGAQVDITLKVGDLEGDPLTFEWSATGGEIRGDDSGAVWTAPEEERKYLIEIRVSDGIKSTTSTLDLQVWRTRPGNYYPLAVGNIWRYGDDEGNQIVFEVVDTIEINLADGELVDSFVVAKYDPNEVEEERIFNFSYLGIHVDENGEVKGINQHAQNVTSGTNDTILFAPFLPLYNFPLIPGNKWKTHFQAQLTPELFPIGGGVDEFEVISEETVTVPAGTFEHVFQVQESFKWSFFEQDLDTTVAQKWLAPDVGLIKFTQAQTRADVTVDVEFELEFFDLVDE
ncbi:MAG: hypothetical protein O7E52_10845 [Candidatus Poribacteria bacterium]|nr:hypothetical protein [Candidatus Poribacteria bacterium]